MAVPILVDGLPNREEVLAARVDPVKIGVLAGIELLLPLDDLQPGGRDTECGCRAKNLAAALAIKLVGVDKGFVAQRRNPEPEAGHRPVSDLAAAGNRVIPVNFLIFIGRTIGGKATSSVKNTCGISCKFHVTYFSEIFYEN